MSAVLIVDDSPQITITMSAMVEAAGHSASVAFNGVSALSQIEDQAFALVFLDHHMPGMSGLDVLRTLGMSGQWGRAGRVVMFSSSDFGRNDALALGAAAFVLKTDVERLWAELDQVAKCSPTDR